MLSTLNLCYPTLCPTYISTHTLTHSEKILLILTKGEKKFQNISKDTQETCKIMYEIFVIKRHFKSEIEKYLKESKHSEAEV